MLLEDLMNAIADFFFGILYRCFAGICVLIDFIKSIFYKLCGIDKVSINGEDTDLLSTLMNSYEIRRTFLIITVIGTILLVVFTIIAIVRSCYQEKQNWKTVMSKNLQSFVIMIIIPFTILSGILLTNVVMTSINQAMQGNFDGTNGTIGGQFLVTIGNDAYKGDASQRNYVEQMFISGKLDYSNLATVKQFYDIGECNYVIGLFGSIVILVMFVLSSLTFVQRIFDIVLLYLISPISTATIPLDEGNRFKVWNNLRSAMAFSKAAKTMIGGGAMSLIAGSDYKAMRQKKKSKGEAFKASLHSTRNQRVVKDGVKKSRAKQIAAMPLRLATMPAGMIHDLSRGGLIQVGKNFVPRLRNAFTGDTLTNRADVTQKKIPMCRIPFQICRKQEEIQERLEEP